MKIKAIFLAIPLLTISNLAMSAIYKCEDDTGKVSYQDQPCAKHQTSKEVNVSILQSTQKQERNVGSNNKPAGNWVNEKNSVFTAYLSISGTFSMTDNKGASARGSWSKKGKDAYVVKAIFQGMSFTINMRYDQSSDTLFLSKIGFPNSFREYRRK